MSQCKVSVIIPVYNMEQYISECLDSVMNQSLKDIEIICIDDCSTDSSAIIINKFKSKDRRIRYFKLDNNSGSGPARNMGISNANGQFSIFLDPDDFYYNNTVLETLYTKAIENSVNIVAGNMLIYDIPTQRKSVFIPSLHFNEERFYSYKKEYPSCFGYQSFLFKTSLLRDNNLYFPNYIRRQDPVFLLNVMLKNDTFYGINDFVYVYRIFHKEINWNTCKKNDFLSSCIDNFTILRNYNLPNHFLSELNEFRYLISQNVFEDENILELYLKVIQSISYDFLKTAILPSILEHEKVFINQILNKLKESNKKQIIIYGFGNIGIALYEQLKMDFEIISIYDQTFRTLLVNSIQIQNGFPINLTKDILIVLTIYNENTRTSIIKELIKNSISPSQII